MQNALGRVALLLVLVGCGGGGTGETNGTGGGVNGGAGGGGMAAGGGASGVGEAGAGGAAGAVGSSGAAALAAGSYAGTASGANCVGFPDLTAGCTVQITITGNGPTYQVTGFMLPGGISGTGLTVSQTGGNVAVDLLTDSTADFCPATEYTGNGTVGGGGTSMAVSLTGPPCGSSDTVFLGLTLTKQ